jgi:glucose 1-dehydrogenase
MLTKTMALEVADKGIRINGIAPGASTFMMSTDKLERKKKWKNKKRITLHRMGEPPK